MSSIKQLVKISILFSLSAMLGSNAFAYRSVDGRLMDTQDIEEMTINDGTYEAGEIDGMSGAELNLMSEEGCAYAHEGYALARKTKLTRKKQIAWKKAVIAACL